MTRLRGWFIVALLSAAALPAPAQQTTAAQAQPAWPAPPAPGQVPQIQVQPMQQPQPQQTPPCAAEFFRLRDETQKKANAIRTASEHHAPPKEACGLFNTFVASETKLIKYATDNAVWCSIPPQVIANMKKGHEQALQIRARVCQAAAQPQVPPHQPTLSDALGAPVTDQNNIKTGRGTFDTLTGTPLGPK